MKARTMVAWVSTANIILIMLVPEEGLTTSVQVHSLVVGMEDRTPDPEPRREVSVEKLEMFLSKLNLSRITDWPDEDHQEVRKVLAEHVNLFALNDLYMGKTSVVKYHIKLTDHTSFKEKYHHILQCQFKEVRNHLQEMLAIGAIKRSKSPWTSVVVTSKENGWQS